MNNFPPLPVFPVGVDSDYTLFHVYNTTETVLTENNPPWSEEISIRPQDGDEVWPDNGFATIEGELFYYDAVGKNVNGKVNKLKRCLRNIGGRPTQYNNAGTWVRGFVVAEHHAKLVDAILSVENFVGENFSDDETTLDWRIRNLAEQPVVFDDFSCPDVEFTFTIVSSDPNTGTVVDYSVTVQGGFGAFDVQFGDGTSSTSAAGTHNYAPNAVIDPVVIVTNDNCQVVQTPIERDQAEEPAVRATVPPFSVPIPVNPVLPSLIFPIMQIPSVDIVMPPIVFPGIDLNPILAAIPSLNLGIPEIQIPSLITFSPLNIPSIITFIPDLDIPSVITFLNVPSFSPINFGPAPSFVIAEFGPAPGFDPIGFAPTPSFDQIGFGPAPTFGPIGFGPGPSFDPIGFGPAPSFVIAEFGPAPVFDPIGFGPAPSFGPIGFGPAPAFDPVGFGPAPSFGPIGFGPAPSFGPIGFGPAPAFDPVGFGPAPTFDPIGFGPAPSVMVTFGPVPTFDPILFGPAPSFGPIGFGPAPTFDPIGFGPAPSFAQIEFAPAPSIMVTFGPAPTFDPILFGPAPVVQFGPAPAMVVAFGPAPSIGPIEFGPAPTFNPILFGPAPVVQFGPAPAITVQFGPAPSLGLIEFGPAPSFNPIVFGPAPSFGPIGFGPAPTVAVDWGSPPTVPVTVTVVCPSSNSVAPMAMRNAAFGLDNFSDPTFDNIELQYDMVGFPSEITIAPPDIPPIVVQHDIPQMISLFVPEIKITGPVIPTEIKIIPPDLDTIINVVSFALPRSIKLEMDAESVPVMSLSFPSEMPVISFDTSGIPESIRVVGIPDVITINHPIPSVIVVDVPADLKIPLVFDGPPLSAELKINWGFDKLQGADTENLQCFALVPCPRG